VAAVPAVRSDRTALELIRRGMNIAPTIKTRAGYAFNMVVTQDVVFPDPYEERVHA
jgi:type IV secretion system protein VirB10